MMADVRKTAKYEERLVTISPRPPSVLFTLPPRGLGTPEVESLSSYIARLAKAHRVPTGVLVARVIAPALGRSDIFGAERRDRSNYLTSYLQRGRSFING